MKENSRSQFVSGQELGIQGRKGFGHPDYMRKNRIANASGYSPIRLVNAF